MFDYRYNARCLMFAAKLTDSQLNLTHRTKCSKIRKQLKAKTDIAQNIWSR